MKCECLVCGKKWYAAPINLLKKHKATGCPHCKKSHGEKEIADWLNKMHIQFIPQVKFDDLRGIKGSLLSYDFLIPESKKLIEFQGEYHDHTVSIQTEEDFATQQEHDRRKKEYAIKNGYQYIPIWYYENIEEKLKEYLYDIINPVTITA